MKCDPRISRHKRKQFQFSHINLHTIGAVARRGAARRDRWQHCLAGGSKVRVSCETHRACVMIDGVGMGESSQGAARTKALLRVAARARQPLAPGAACVSSQFLAARAPRTCTGVRITVPEARDPVAHWVLRTEGVLAARPTAREWRLFLPRLLLLASHD
eukprot:352507-Chlamydomonas_euryale.AAC.12